MRRKTSQPTIAQTTVANTEVTMMLNIRRGNGRY